MKLIERRANPSPSDLKWFGVIVLALLGLIGGLVWWRSESFTAGLILWAIGLASCGFYYAVRPL